MDRLHESPGAEAAPPARAPVLPPALASAIGNRALARLASDEHAADAVALAAVGVGHGRSVRAAVEAVTGADLRDVSVRRGALPGGVSGRAEGRTVTLAPDAGARVLAHELAHVALGHEGAQHFIASERPQIGNLEQVIADARRMAEAHGALGLMRWGRFCAAAGGMAVAEVAERVAGSQPRRSEMRIRYLYTDRCGLIDLRHFYQLMWIALSMGNQEAVHQGREHELEAEETSRFAPEDTTSNALGSLFGSQQSMVERIETFLANLRSFLERCSPVDWSRMPVTEQDAVVQFYDARTSAGTPLHQNETANPEIPVQSSVAAPRHGIFPFVQGTTDGVWNTYTGYAE